MALTGSISRNSITPSGSSFQVDLNVEAQATIPTGSIIGYDFIRNGIIENTVTIPPTNNYSNIITYIENSVGTHVYEIKFKTIGAIILNDSITLTFDHDIPVVNSFNLIDIEKLASGEFEINIEVHLQDTIGIERYEIEDLSDSSVSSFNPIASASNLMEVYQKTLPSGFTGTRTFRLTAWDFAGNSSTPQNTSFTISAVPPTIDSMVVTGINKVLDEYILDVQIIGTTVAGQNVEEYSLEVNNSVPDWKTTPFTSGTFTLNKQVKVANSVLAGTVTIFANVRDTSANIGANTIPYMLDKTPPVGTVDLQNIHKSGGSYYGDIVLTASDAGQVAGYAWAFDNQNPSPIVPTTPAISFNTTIPSQLIGSSGANTIYAKFVDASGNQSVGEISKSFVIDTTQPEVNLELLGTEKVGSNYNFTFQVSANDNKDIAFEKFFAENSNTSTVITGHNANWQPIALTQIINAQQTLVIPNTETEDPINFYWQVKDNYGNESVIASTTVDFDKTIPVISNLNYFDVEKGSSFYRIFADLMANDSVGITAYRAEFDDVANATWQTITANTHIDERIYLDFPVPDFGNTKNFVVEVRDQLGNISANSSFAVAPNMQIPTGTASISSGSFTANSFNVGFQLDAQKPIGTGDVYWYSILTGDATIRDWKPLTTPNNIISEIQSIVIPRTSDGVQDFYVYFADEWKNESPAIHVQYDLDAVSVFGGIDLERVTLSSGVYTANLHLYAFDNKTVNEYEFNGIANPISPVKILDVYREENMGSVAGLRSYDVLYRDGFGNESNTYNLTLNLETNPPNVHIRYDWTNFVGGSYDMTLTMITDDDTLLRDYKFWYGSTEPTTWTDFPPQKTNQEVTQTFTVPFSDAYPDFYVKVKDLFDNESTNTISKTINTNPPSLPILSVNTSNYTAVGTKLSIDYSTTASPGSVVRRLFVIPSNGGSFSVPCGNAPIANGTFEHVFPLSYTSGSFTVYAESDYGYSTIVPVSITEVFDANPPANVAISHVNSFNNGSQYKVIVNIQSDDHESGIVQVNLKPQYLDPSFITYPVSQTSVLNEDFVIDIPSTFTDSTLRVSAQVVDLLGNASTYIDVYGIPVDRTNPMINTIIFNNGTTFLSTTEGADVTNVNVRFMAYDFSKISHYKFSKTDDDVLDSSWTMLPTPLATISINESVDLTSLGFTDGLNTLYIHVRDTHGNISVAGHNFELDTTPPNAVLTYNNVIERMQIGITDFFVIPYDVHYTDNYSGIITRDIWQEDTSGTVSNLLTQVVSPVSNNVVSNNSQRLISGNLGLTTFKENVTDRFNHVSANTEFSVYLKTNIPTIHEFSLVGNATYTNTEHIFFKLDVEATPMAADDTVPLTNYMFSTSNNAIWSDTNWDNFLNGPTDHHTRTHSIDLLALGFTPGVCNVYAYVKDSCQNVANSNISIIYDPTAPTINEFRVNGVSRGFSTYDIELVANTTDSISGVLDYVISQSAIDTNYSNVGPTPIVGTDVLLNEIEPVPLSDYGMKYFYFKVIDAAGNEAEANTSFYIDGVLPLAASFTATSSYSNYYLSSAKNQFSFVISDNNALLDVRYELQGIVNPITSYDPNLSITNDSNTFNADFSTLSEGIYRIYLEIEDTFENVSRIPYEFYFDDTPPTISNFIIKEIQPNPAPSATVDTYTVEFSITASDTVKVNEYKLFENNVLIETIPMDAVSFTATPTITTLVTGTETKTFELKVFDLAGNETSALINETMTTSPNMTVDSFIIDSFDSFGVTFSYDASSSVDVKEFALTTQASIDYESSLWEPIIGAPSTTVSKSGIVRLYGDIGLLPGSPQNLYLHVKDECGNQAVNMQSFSPTVNVPLLSAMTPSVDLKREGNFYVGSVSFTANGTNSVVGYYIGLEHDSEKFKSTIPMNSGDSMTQQFKIPVSQINGSETLYIRLLDDTGKKSPNYRVSVEAREHKMEKFELYASEHMAGTTNQIDVLFDTTNDPYNIQYAYVIDNSTRPTTFSPANAIASAMGEFEFNFNVPVNGIGSGDHKLWVWLKTTQEEYSFRGHDFRSEPGTTPPTASLSIIKAHVYKGKKIVYVEMQATDLGVGISEVSIVESPATHTFKTIPTTNFKKHIEIFEYALSDNAIMTYSGAAKDAIGIQSSPASTTLDLGTII